MLTYFYVYLDQQGAEMLEMQQIPPQEQGYSQLFLSGQLTNNNISIFLLVFQLIRLALLWYLLNFVFLLTLI